MPDFPRYDSQENLTTRRPHAGIPDSTAGETGRLLAGAGKALQETSLKWMKAIDTMHKTVFEANTKVALADLEDRASADPNHNALEKYMKEYQDIRKENAKGFASKSAEAESLVKYDLASKISAIKVRGIFRKKQILATQTATQRIIDEVVKNPGHDQRARDVAMGYIEDLLRERSDFFDPKELYKMQQDAEADLKQNAFIRDVELNTPLAKERLKNNDYGFDVSKRAQAYKILDGKERRDEEANLQAQMDTTTQFVKLLVEGNLTPGLIRDALSAGYDPQLALSFELATAGPDRWKDFSSEREMSDEAKIVTDALAELDTDDVQKRMNIVNSALKNYNGEKISDKENLIFILGAVNGKSNDPKNPIWNKLSSAMKWMQAIQSPTGPIAIQMFMEMWDGKGDPATVAKEAVKNARIAETPAIAAYQEGQVVERGGRKFKVIVNSDGTLGFEQQ